MKRIAFFGLLLMYGLLSIAQPNKTSKASMLGPKVQIVSGIVQGISDGKVDAFKGIPYAAAPIGPLRWRAPQPAVNWKGVRDASKFCADCAQASWPRSNSNAKIRENTSEDCLFINIWRPSEVKNKNKIPVMVWIYGGAFVGGGSSSPNTSGEQFAEKGVILVSFNYRLGRLGHFAFPALSEENPNEPKGSYAFMDQIAALHWIKENIESFGGDPGNVTIFGESAGGVSVHSLLTIPSAQGLFHKAIIESGGGRDGVLTGRPIREENVDPYYPVSAETIGINFARKHGIQGTDALALTKLRELPVEVIVDNGLESDPKDGSIIYPGPILDGGLVVESAETAYKNGRQPDIPIIIGSNSAEVSSGFVNAQSKEELFAQFAPYEKEAKNAFDQNGNKAFSDILNMVNTDKVWAEPARLTARAFSQKGTDSYIYLFDYVQNAFEKQFELGAPHATEIPYVFNTLSSRPDNQLTERDLKVASLMNTYWANFAKTGNPNADGLPLWEKYNKENDILLEIRRDGTAISSPDPKKARLDVIEKATKNLK
ncbi:carboxylesterase/lipase family protein [Sphingobacterium sp.]|uniref:carboxylesterase/lipase family protein n=1 Tax=Sphingobacterium sp. TaxID=341027 RepID=UPI0028A5D164|nr:carboxylesterase family protein [Sphingobacterium sp.]